jgi:hypothetical protein
LIQKQFDSLAEVDKLQSMATCNKCGTFVDEPDNLDERQPCSQCGSLSRSFGVGLSTEAVGQPEIKAKGRHGQPGQVKPFVTAKLADEVFHETRERTLREKMEDRDNDRYHERVISQETGALLHECNEPLSEHQGHGSAKKKP